MYMESMRMDVNPNRTINAYNQSSKHSETGAQTDAFVLERAAFRLEELKSEKNIDKWEEYIKHNVDIWTTIQGEMINPGNTLPDLVKANIVSLSIFVDKASFELLSGDRSLSKLNTLININRNIALGLRGNPGTGS